MVKERSSEKKKGANGAHNALGPNDDGAVDGGGAERQQAGVVLGEDGALAHAVARELERVAVAHALGADFVQRAGAHGVKVAEPDAHAEEPAEHYVHILLCDIAVGQRLGRVGRHEPAAVDVRARGKNQGNGLLRRRRVMVRVKDVTVGVAVARHIAVKLPRVAQQRAQQPLVGAARHAVDGVVAWGEAGKGKRRAFYAHPSARKTLAASLSRTAHNAGGFALFHAGLEGRQVRVHEILLRHEDVDVVAVSTIPAIELVLRRRRRRRQARGE